MSLQPEVLGSLFDMSRDPVIGIDKGHAVVFANPAAEQLGFSVGMDAGELLPEHILSDPAEQFIASLQLCARRANVSIRRLGDVTVCTFSLLSTDLPSTSQVRAFQDMSAQLMTVRLALDALTAHIGPEGDAVVQNAACTLYKQYYQLRRICQHLNQSASILRGDLAFQPRAVDLGKVCRELCDTVGLLAESMRISVAFKADMGMHLTMADRELLEQMLAGLLTNSLTHCKPGDVIQVELTRQGERFIIAVNDPGTGIAPERMAGLFNDTLPDGGTDASVGAGMGLLIARGIAERHGGTLILSSRPGEGTSVRVSIPCRRSESTTINSPMARYRSDGMNTVLTELAPLLKKEIFTRKLFD